jgi:hypothetical protein
MQFQGGKMQVFDVSEFTKNTAKIFDSALTDEVIINNGGNSYKLLPLKKTGNSPVGNIPRTKLDITAQEIVEILYGCSSGV